MPKGLHDGYRDLRKEEMICMSPFLDHNRTIVRPCEACYHNGSRWCLLKEREGHRELVERDRLVMVAKVGV